MALHKPCPSQTIDSPVRRLGNPPIPGTLGRECDKDGPTPRGMLAAWNPHKTPSSLSPVTGGLNRLLDLDDPVRDQDWSNWLLLEGTGDCDAEPSGYLTNGSAVYDAQTDDTRGSVAGHTKT